MLAGEIAYEAIIFCLSARHWQRGVEPSPRMMAAPFVPDAAYSSRPASTFRATSMAGRRSTTVFDGAEDARGDVPARHRRLDGFRRGAVEVERWAYLLGYYLPFNLTIFIGNFVLVFSKSRRLLIAALTAMLGWFVLVTARRHQGASVFSPSPQHGLGVTAYPATGSRTLPSSWRWSGE